MSKITTNNPIRLLQIKPSPNDRGENKCVKIMQEDKIKRKVKKKKNVMKIVDGGL